MVKREKFTEEELLQEDERLEKIFREKIRKQKNLEINDKQFQNRILDLLDDIFKSSISNKTHFSLILKKAPGILTKFCLSTKFEHLNGQKIIKTLIHSISENQQEISKFPEAVDTIVKTIFNIFVYKKPKEYTSDLLTIILVLLKTQNKKIEKIVEQNLGTIISFLEKGKEVDKVFFTFRKILSHSHFCLHSRFEELLNILGTSSNVFFCENFIKFLYDVFHSKLLIEQNLKTEQENKVNLKNFASSLDHYVLQICDNVTQLRDKFAKDDDNKLAKTIQNLKMLLEFLLTKANSENKANLSKALAALKFMNKKSGVN